MISIQHDDENSYLESLVVQAQAAAEDFCRVTFDTNAPEPVRLAVLLMVSHFYENWDNPDKQVSLLWPVERRQMDTRDGPYGYCERKW